MGRCQAPQLWWDGDLRPVHSFVLPEALTSDGAASVSWGEALRAGVPAAPPMLTQTLERKVSQGSELWAQPDPASVKTLGPAVHRCCPSSLSLARQEEGSPRQAQGCGEWVGGWGAGLSTPRTSEDCWCGGRGRGTVGLCTSARLTLFLSVKQILSLSLQTISSFASQPVTATECRLSSPSSGDGRGLRADAVGRESS